LVPLHGHDVLQIRDLHADCSQPIQGAKVPRLLITAFFVRPTVAFRHRSLICRVYSTGEGMVDLPDTSALRSKSAGLRASSSDGLVFQSGICRRYVPFAFQDGFFAWLRSVYGLTAATVWLHPRRRPRRSSSPAGIFRQVGYAYHSGHRGNSCTASRRAMGPSQQCEYSVACTIACWVIYGMAGPYCHFHRYMCGQGLR